MSDNLLQSLTILSEPLKISFGPNGSDHLIISGNHSTITNDGATILSLLTKRKGTTKEKNILSNLSTHPMLNLLIKLSKTQEQISGDGTTSVVLLVGSLANQIRKLIKKYKKNSIIETLEIIRKEINNYIFEEITKENKEDIYIKIVRTTLSSKILDPISEKISKLAIEAVKKSNKEFERIKINKMYGSIEEMSLIEGYLITKDNKIINKLKEKNINKLKTCFIQFCLSPPKPNLDTSITINNSNLIDKLIKDERIYIKNLINKLKEKKIDILIIQKSLTRETISELAEYYLNKENINYILFERDVIEKLCYELKAKKSQNINFLDIFEFNYKIELVANELFLILKENNLLTLNITGTDLHIRDEAERSLHDAMSVIRCLMEDPFYCYGGGHFELSFSNFLREKYCSFNNENIENINFCMNDLIKGIEQLPYYLAINSGYDFNLIEDLKLSINNKLKLGVIPNLLINYNDFLFCFDEKKKELLSNKNNKIISNEIIQKDETLSDINDEIIPIVNDSSLNLRKELINEKLKCFDVSEILIPKKVVVSQIVLACELLEIVTRIDEVLPAKK